MQRRGLAGRWPTMLATAAVCCLLLAGAPARAVPITRTFTFDDITNLAQYKPLGLAFSPNASLWSASAPSVLDDPNGGARSLPNALQFGAAGGELGWIEFADPADLVSIWALSGPGPDPLTSPIWIRAYDEGGVLLAQDVANSSLQFDELVVAAPRIVRLELWSPQPFNDVWDDLTVRFTPPTGTDPRSARPHGARRGLRAWRRR